MKDMKQILYIMLALFAVLANSCTNDDIVIEKTGRLHSLTLNINTQGMLTEFDFSSTEVMNLIRDQDMAIVVKTFVYDSNGSLVTSQESREFTLSPAIQSFDALTEGSYTIISVESIVMTTYEDTEYPWYPWQLADTEKLSSLKINQLRNDISYFSVLGVASQSITVDDNESITVQPSAIGSIIHLYFLNFNESTYISAGFGTSDIISGYRLDPSIQQSDRYMYETTSSGKFRLRGGALIEGNSVKHITKYILDKHIDYRFCFTENQEKYDEGSYSSWPSNKYSTDLNNGKTYYGGAYYISDSEPLDCYFGDESGFDKWAEEVIEKDTQLIPDFYMTWGGTVSATQNAMSGYNLIEGSPGNAAPQENGTFMLRYGKKGKVDEIVYSFTSATTGLCRAALIYDKSDVSTQELLDILKSEYNLVDEEDSEYLFLSNDQKTVVWFYTIDFGPVIDYFDYNYYVGYGSKRKAPSIKGSNILNIQKQKLRMHTDSSKKDNILISIDAEKINTLTGFDENLLKEFK